MAYSHNYFSGRQRAFLAALIITGAFCMPSVAEAAIQTEPMIVTDKDKAIDDDFQVVNQKYPAVIDIDSSSTGTVQINSGNIHIENTGSGNHNIGVIKTENGWTGTLNLKEGARVSGKFTGKDVRADGLDLDGFGYLKDEENTGNPYPGIANVGNDVSFSFEADNATDYASIQGIEVDGEHAKAQNGLSISVSAHTGNFAEVSGLEMMHYGKAQIGDNLSIHVVNQIDADSNHNLTDGIITMYNLVQEENDIHAKGRQALSIGNNAHITTEARNDQNHMISTEDSESEGIRLSHTDFTMGDGAVLNTTGGAMLEGTYGINTNYHTVARIGNDLTNTVTVNGEEHFVTGARIRNHGYADDGDKDIVPSLTIGDRGKTIVSYVGDSSYNETDGLVNIGGNFYLGNDNEVRVTLQNTGTDSAEAYGIDLESNGKLEVKNNFTTVLHTFGTITNSIGLYSESGSASFGDHAKMEVEAEGHADIVSGLWTTTANVKAGDDASFLIKGNIAKPVFKAASQIRGIYIGNGSGIIGDNLTLQVSGHNYAMVSGLAAFAGNGANSLSVGDNARITVSAAEDETGTTNGLSAVGGNYIAGIKNWGKGSSVTTGKNAQIEVTAPSDKDTSAVWTTKSAETTLGDGAVLKLSSSASNVNAVVMNQSGGKTAFTGGAVLIGNKNAIESSGSGSEVTMTGNGRKVIMGDLLSEDSGAMNLNLNTSDSLFRGKSTVDGGTTDLTLADGARWDMTDSSRVSNLGHENGGTVNMQYNPEYQRLDIGNYSGTNGLFLMKTDLNSETDGDKVYMDSAAAGSRGLIKVHDESFLTGKEVTGTKHLLLVTDNSKNASFTGEAIDEGGLWDVTPEIRNGSYVRSVMGDKQAKDTEWYLTKLTKTVNKDTVPLIRSADNSYALYRNSIDTLRQRLGDLRFHKAEDNSGIWARNTYGAYSGSGIYSKENRFQLGYDHWANRKSVYGILAERGIASPRYSYGKGKDHTLAGALYGTWFGDSGSYTDVVAKVGRDDTSIHTYGNYADKADYRSREESISIEYGRTHKLNDKGLFVEPQAQIVFGHLNHVNYATERGKTVHMDSYNSAIGRLGFVLGDRKPEATRPFDYYIKASILHEFGGDRDFYLTAPDGETMDREGHYRDTWYEVGLGGTFRVKPDVYIYGDADREFGGKWNEKWRVNMGIHFTF